MIRCSGIKKTDCTKGRGCAKSEKKEKHVKSIEKTEDISGPLSGKVIAFSSFSNDDLKTKIKALGGIVRSSITKKTNLVVYKPARRNNNKIEQLKAEGIKVMTLEAFLKKQGIVFDESAPACGWTKVCTKLDIIPKS